MIDHTSFTDAYKTYSGWMSWRAIKLCKSDPETLIADTWARVWSGKHRIKAITPGLLLTIMWGVARSNWKKHLREQRHLENFAHLPKPEWEDCELPEIDPDKLPACDRNLYQRLLKYCQREGQTHLKDTAIPRSTLKGFRVRMRKRFLEKAD